MSHDLSVSLSSLMSILTIIPTPMITTSIYFYYFKYIKYSITLNVFYYFN